MKHNYDEYPGETINALYYKVFGVPFLVNWDDNHANHRQEIIDCIESGVPQNEDTISGGWTTEDAAHGVPGVDFVE
ncbi:MAG: hypothetical protein Q4A07_10075 [Coriobacteriales bacterium]|nr:hypothetical protein [Coriobacteriales bacterium]